MKKLLFVTWVLFLFFNNNGYSQGVPEGATPINGNQEIPEGAIMINENTIFKDENGDTLEFIKFIEMMESGEWTSEPIKDDKGQLQYVLLKKATSDDKKMRKNAPMNGNNSGLIGKKVPDFEMKDRKGNLISLESTKGKVVVLNFWFAACKPCIAEIPELNEVYEKYENDTNIVFASITFEKKDKVDEFLKKYPFEYPVVSDAKEICDSFNVSSFPTNIIIDKNGTYYQYLMGGNPSIGEHISAAISGALKEE